MSGGEFAANIIRCPHCRLHQYRTRDGNCRRCRKPFVETSAPEPPLVVPEQHDKLSQFRGSLVGDCCRLLRWANGWSQLDLGRRVGWARTQVSKYETTVTTPNPVTVIRIAGAFGLSAEAFLRIAEAIQ